MKYNLILYSFAFFFGMFKLIRWTTNDERLPLDLLLSIVFICAGVVIMLNHISRMREALLIRYMMAGIILLLATFYSSTFLFWGTGLFVLITAISDTIQRRSLRG